MNKLHQPPVGFSAVEKDVGEHQGIHKCPQNSDYEPETCYEKSQQSHEPKHSKQPERWVGKQEGKKQCGGDIEQQSKQGPSCAGRVCP